jgi:hypothetical protein
MSTINIKNDINQIKVSVPKNSINITSAGAPASWGSINGSITNQSDLVAYIDAHSNTYVLPTATTLIKGGVKIGDRLTMVGDVLTADIQPQLQSDYNQTDNTKADYIKNKPTLYNDTNARHAISENVLGLDYDNSTGVFSLTDGYIIPTVANFNNKVDSVSGKGLSTNDFTDYYKSKLDSSVVSVFMGTWDASHGTYPTSTPSSGDYWVISVGGTLGGVAYVSNDWLTYNSITGWGRIASSGVQDADVVHITGNETIYGQKIFNDIVVIDNKLAIGTPGFDTNNPEFLKVDGQTSASSNIISGYGDYNSYVQLNIKNRNSGVTASSDIVATSDIGTESNNFVDMGINSSTYDNSSFTVCGALDAYNYVDGGDYAIGTSTSGKIVKFFTGGTLSNNVRMVLSDNGLDSNVNITAPNISNLATKAEFQKVKNMAIAMAVAL